MKKIVLISGATSGIGRACAEKFASNGYNIIITGRRKERLEELKKLLEAKFETEVMPLCFDIQKKGKVANAIQRLPENWNKISILINNAGLALGKENFEDADMEDWEIMLNTNIYGLLYLTKAVLPYMVMQKQGHIINIGSVAAKDIYEKGNVYCATKAAADAISKALRIDLLKHHIKVTAVHPGAVETEFSLVRFKGNEEKAKATYNGFTPLTAVDVADTIYHCASLPAHVCINDIVITGIQQANSIYFHKNQ